MNPDLKALIQLQEIDTKILELDKQIQTVPAQIQAIQQSIDAGTTRLASLKEALFEKQKSRKKSETDTELLRAKLVKLKDQLMTVKTNKEYTAMLKEIESCDHEIRKAEDSVLEFMVSLEQLEADLRNGTREVQVEGEKLLAQRKVLENLLANHQTARGGMTAERDGVAQRVPEGLLDRYQRISRSRKSIAVAEARDECCMACRVRMRPQIYNDLRRNDLILSCDSCGRILYWVAPPPAAAPAQTPAPASAPAAPQASAEAPASS